MNRPTKRFWNKIKKFLPSFLITIVCVCVAIGIIWLILVGYSYEGTGFGASTIPTYPDREIQPEKKLWDWLGLLVVPIVLALGATMYTWIERKNEQGIADNRAQDAALQSYLEQMSILLIDKGLYALSSESVEANIARAWTLTFLRRINGNRKGVLLRFLYETKLIRTDNLVVSLHGSDLEGADLIGAGLEGADLRGVNLMGANLIWANLMGANLMHADLHKADLSGAYLEGAILMHANLMGANLTWANLIGANLTWANLSGANLSDANLSVASLNEAKYTATTKWPADFDPTSHGAILIKEK